MGRACLVIPQPDFAGVGRGPEEPMSDQMGLRTFPPEMPLAQ
jgi:hypothetical protein